MAASGGDSDPSRSFQPLVCVVDFNHHRGPEIEHWVGAEGSDPSAENDWHLIPYMALPDGAHQSEEEFSYFSLVHKASAGRAVEPRSVFGISCMHQIDSSDLLFRPEEVTRSAVQKAVVAITHRPENFSALREKLSAITRAWFAQRDFRDIELLQVGELRAPTRLVLKARPDMGDSDSRRIWPKSERSSMSTSEISSLASACVSSFTLSNGKRLCY